MSSIVNDDFFQTKYSNEPSNYDIKNSMSDDQGALNPDIEGGFDELVSSAKKIIKQRKPTYDFNTKNKSFINLYNDLRTLGIKNNKFFLKIYDKDLIGIDPFQKVLPLELQLKIILECIINPWYWLREVCRIPVDGSPIEIGGGSPFLIDRNSAATWYLFLNGIDHYGSKPRQCGKTQDALSKFDYAMHFGSISSTILFLNKDAELSKTNLYRLKCQRDMLPAYMQMKIKFNEDGTIEKETDNITTMRNPITGNTIRVLPRATSKDAAMRLGRGHTAALHYFDEFDFINYNIEIINASAFSYSTASENAKKQNSLYGRIFTSTPADLDSRDGRNATNFIRGTSTMKGMLFWKDEYFDMPINQFKKILNSKSYNGIVFVEHSWKQLKKSMAWYEKQCQLVGYNEEVILREIELQRLRGSSASPFSRDILTYLGKNKRTPINSIDLSDNLCYIDFYEVLNKDYHYILSIDPAEGLSGDNTAFTLINPYTLASAAEFKSPYISPPDMFKLICKFMDKYCNKSLIVIEANRGRELINRFLESKYRYQLYYDKDKMNAKVVETHNRYGALRRQANERRAYGFDTTASSRPILFGILETFVNERRDILYTQNIVSDILTLERRPTGKIEAANGEHDDSLMSYLIGLCVYFNAKNLEDFGIYRGETEPDAISTKDNPKVIIEKMKNIMNILPDEYKKLFSESIQQKNPVDEANKYERQIRQIQRQSNQMHGFNDDNDIYSPIEDDLDDPSFDNNILESNFMYQRSNNPNYYNEDFGFDDTGYDNDNNSFDINDYID